MKTTMKNVMVNFAAFPSAYQSGAHDVPMPFKLLKWLVSLRTQQTYDFIEWPVLAIEFRILLIHQFFSNLQRQQADTSLTWRNIFFLEKYIFMVFVTKTIKICVCTIFDLKNLSQKFLINIFWYLSVQIYFPSS